MTEGLFFNPSVIFYHCSIDPPWPAIELFAMLPPSFQQQKLLKAPLDFHMDCETHPNGDCMDALNCTYDDYQKAAGFSGLDNLVKARPRLGKFFKIENGGMRLPNVHSRILANPSLDKFVMDQFKKFADPNARIFGENAFTITGIVNNYRIGHLERYCGPTLRMNIDTMRMMSGGTVAALAHTHPLFKGINASRLNRDGENFGPGDWIPLVAFKCPTYLHTPRRRTYVMEYNGNFIVVRNLAGGEKKWHVSH